MASESKVNFHLLDKMDDEGYQQLARLLILPYKYNIGDPQPEWLQSQKRKMDGMKRDRLGPTRSFGLRNKLGMALQEMVERHAPDLASDKNGIMQLLPPNATRCEVHRKLNPWLLRELFDLIVQECTRRTQWLRLEQFLDEGEKLPEHIRKHVSRLNAASLLWCGKKLTELTFDGRSDGYFICNDFQFEKVKSGCEACILAAIGGTANFLVHLRAAILGRNPDRKYRSRLLDMVEYWIEEHGDAKDILKYSEEVREQVGEVRRVYARYCKKRRRERRTKGRASGEALDALEGSEHRGSSSHKHDSMVFRENEGLAPAHATADYGTSASTKRSSRRTSVQAPGPAQGLSASISPASGVGKGAKPSAHKYAHAFDDGDDDDGNGDYDASASAQTAAEARTANYLGQYRKPYLDDASDDEVEVVDTKRSKQKHHEPEPIPDDGSTLGWYSNQSHMSLHSTMLHLHPAFSSDEPKKTGPAAIPEETDDDFDRFSHPSMVPHGLAFDKSSGSNKRQPTFATDLGPVSESEDEAAAQYWDKNDDDDTLQGDSPDVDDVRSEWTDVTVRTAATNMTRRPRRGGGTAGSDMPDVPRIPKAYRYRYGEDNPTPSEVNRDTTEELMRMPEPPTFWHTNRRSDMRPPPGEIATGHPRPVSSVYAPTEAQAEARGPRPTGAGAAQTPLDKKEKDKRRSSMIKAKYQVYSNDTYAASSVYSAATRKDSGHQHYYWDKET